MTIGLKMAPRNGLSILQW